MLHISIIVSLLLQYSAHRLKRKYDLAKINKVYSSHHSWFYMLLSMTDNVETSYQIDWGGNFHLLKSFCQPTWDYEVVE